MKKSLVVSLSIAGLLLAASNAFAEDKTFEGKGQCAKCALKKAEKCQNVVVVEKDGKKTTYFLVDKEGSKVSQSFHKNLCQGEKNVKVTGTVKEVGDKHELTVAKIELVEK
ncbi:MAG: hypothetical protein HY735_32535 [Verrucomicrobia bacterium]|nr:hypothetical protein [Verrucomicrobiota bacterium]